MDTHDKVINFQVVQRNYDLDERPRVYPERHGSTDNWRHAPVFHSAAPEDPERGGAYRNTYQLPLKQSEILIYNKDPMPASQLKTIGKQLETDGHTPSWSKGDEKSKKKGPSGVEVLHEIESHYNMTEVPGLMDRCNIKAMLEPNEGKKRADFQVFSPSAVRFQRIEVDPNAVTTAREEQQQSLRGYIKTSPFSLLDLAGEQKHAEGRVATIDGGLKAIEEQRKRLFDENMQARGVLYHHEQSFKMGTEGREALVKAGRAEPRLLDHLVKSVESNRGSMSWHEANRAVEGAYQAVTSLAPGKSFRENLRFMGRQLVAGATRDEDRLSPERRNTLTHALKGEYDRCDHIAGISTAKLADQSQEGRLKLAGWLRETKEAIAAGKPIDLKAGIPTVEDIAKAAAESARKDAVEQVSQSGLRRDKQTLETDRHLMDSYSWAIKSGVSPHDHTEAGKYATARAQEQINGLSELQRAEKLYSLYQSSKTEPTTWMRRALLEEKHGIGQAAPEAGSPRMDVINQTLTHFTPPAKDKERDWDAFCEQVPASMRANRESGSRTHARGKVLNAPAPVQAPAGDSAQTMRASR